MLQITKETINSQKVEILNFMWKKFHASMISIMNGKNRFLTRNNYGYSHLQCTQVVEKNGAEYSFLPKKEYKDFYFYVTTSTTTDYTSKIEQKIKENLSDRCFNVREEVLFAHSDGPTFFLIDFGEYWGYCSVEYARKHIVRVNEYDYRKVCTVRLAKGDFVKKEHENEWGELALNFDATYIQNVTYSQYRKRKGLQVVVTKNGQVQAIKYYISTGAFFDEMKDHCNFKKCTVVKWARENMTKELKPGLFFTFSFVTDISLSSFNIQAQPVETPSGDQLTHYNLTCKKEKRDFNENKNVMSKLIPGNPGSPVEPKLINGIGEEIIKIKEKEDEFTGYFEFL